MRVLGGPLNDFNQSTLDPAGPLGGDQSMAIVNEMKDLEAVVPSFLMSKTRKYVSRKRGCADCMYRTPTLIPAPNRDGSVESGLKAIPRGLFAATLNRASFLSSILK